MMATYPDRIIEPLDYFDWTLLCPRFEEVEHPPFRDAESLRLLKESYDIVFASDEDWYSVIIEGTRMSVSCVNKGLKFALTAIDVSRRGLYTQYRDDVGEEVWRVLADLPIDILVAAKQSEIGVFSNLTEGVEFTILNYSYKNQSIEVTVKDFIHHKDSFYTAVPESHENGTSHGLHIGKDGRYYSDEFGVRYALQYYWKNDVKGIIEYIDGRGKGRIHMENAIQTYDIFELEKMLKQEENSIARLDYLQCVRCLERRLEEKAIDESAYAESLKELQEGDSYKEYLYFRDRFRVIWNVADFQIDTMHRKLPMLIVDKSQDGTYFIHGGLTVKYPTFDELLEDAVSRRNKELESFILVVDVEELLDSASDIKEAVCGFKVLEDSVEVFDSREAIRAFGEALKEAYHSGKCTIDKEFY